MVVVADGLGYGFTRLGFGFIGAPCAYREAEVAADRLWAVCRGANGRAGHGRGGRRG